MAKPISMPDSVRIPIYDVFSRAKCAVETGNYVESERLCDVAWELIPEPKLGWDVSYICLKGMVDFLRAGGSDEKAIKLVETYLASEHYDDFEHGPYFWLGTLYYEKGNLDKAYSYFERDNKMSKSRCFEEENSKYKTFFKTYKTKRLN
jgi:tetratricopeptide (TPR) repeat protein